MVFLLRHSPANQSTFVIRRINSHFLVPAGNAKRFALLPIGLSQSWLWEAVFDDVPASAWGENAADIRFVRRPMIDKRMKYELAKELRDAGFPQTGNGKSVGPPDALVMRRGDGVYAPTLAELIRACGIPFTLEGNVVAADAPIWMAESSGLTADGATPEEAVARLWLGLQSRI